MSERWPNFFVVGAAKAGTTSLHAYLAGHPEIYMAAVKEPHYFSRLKPSPERRPFLPTIDGERTYLNLFRDAGDRRVRGESSTSYLTVPDAARRIRERCPTAKAVILLREPVSRAHSHFLADVRDGVERRSFRQAIEDELSGSEQLEWGVSGLYVTIGRYAEDVARYRRLFGTNLHVLFFEDLVADPTTNVRQVLDFLGVDGGYANSLSPEPHNPYRRSRAGFAGRIFSSPHVRVVSRRLLPRGARARVKESLTKTAPKPSVPVEDWKRLTALYRPDVKQLTKLLGRRPPWPAYAEPGRNRRAR
jgi:hypothetical protein